jgi:hypothetical protein
MHQVQVAACRHSSSPVVYMFNNEDNVRQSYNIRKAASDQTTTRESWAIWWDLNALSSLGHAPMVLTFCTA